MISDKKYLSLCFTNLWTRQYIYKKRLQKNKCVQKNGIKDEKTIFGIPLSGILGIYQVYWVFIRYFGMPLPFSITDYSPLNAVNNILNLNLKKSNV